MFARYGLEEREPFFDRRVIELALALPEHHRRRGGRTKHVLRHALRSKLPWVADRSGKAYFDR